jgi:hypothetical protein
MEALVALQLTLTDSQIQTLWECTSTEDLDTGYATVGGYRAVSEWTLAGYINEDPDFTLGTYIGHFEGKDGFDWHVYQE